MRFQGGESIRVVHPLFQVEGGGSIPTSPLQLHINEIGVNQARYLNELWHSRFPVTDESNILRNPKKICFSAEYDGVFYASAIWTTPVAANRLKDGFMLLELRRMAIADDAPRNTASRMLKIMVMMIRKRFPDLVGLISYQDSAVHQGTIYKASGWKQESTSKFEEWDTKTRKRSAPQSTSPKVRWRFDL